MTSRGLYLASRLEGWETYRDFLGGISNGLEQGLFVIFTVWIHGHGPVHEEEIHVIQAQALQALIQALLDT